MSGLLCTVNMVLQQESRYPPVGETDNKTFPTLASCCCFALGNADPRAFGLQNVSRSPDMPTTLFVRLLPHPPVQVVLQPTSVMSFAADAADSFQGTPAPGATAHTAPSIATRGITSNARRISTGKTITSAASCGSSRFRRILCRWKRSCLGICMRA